MAMASHVLPQRSYYLVFAVLILLTVLTVAVSFVELGPWHVVVALAIALVKASLVILLFMHVYYDTRLTWLVITGSLFFLGILFALTLTDYLSRSWLSQPG
jgi:cytochrome c oxidase subunit 4